MTEPHRRQVKQAAERASEPLVPSLKGSHQAKEAWMRQRQRERTAAIEGEREAELLAEAEADRHRRAILRLQQEIELRTQLVKEAELIIAKRGRLKPCRRTR